MLENQSCQQDSMTIQMSGTISKHDIYGSHFKTAYNNTGNDIELSLEDFEEVEQENDIEDVMEE